MRQVSQDGSVRLSLAPLVLSLMSIHRPPLASPFPSFTTFFLPYLCCINRVLSQGFFSGSQLWHFFSISIIVLFVFVFLWIVIITVTMDFYVQGFYHFLLPSYSAVCLSAHPHTFHYCKTYSLVCPCWLPSLMHHLMCSLFTFLSLSLLLCSAWMCSHQFVAVCAHLQVFRYRHCGVKYSCWTHRHAVWSCALEAVCYVSRPIAHRIWLANAHSQ